MSSDKKPNILFVNLVTSLSEGGQIDKDHFRLVMPMGILYLSSCLKKYKEEVGEVGILDYALESIGTTQFKNIEEFICKSAEKVKFTPDIISITLMFYSQYYFFEICAEQLKRMWKNSIIIVGGVQATNCTKQLMQNPNVDYTLRGEGEIAFPRFVREIAKSTLPNIKGIYSRDNYAPETQLEVCEMVKNLDDIPYPDWDLIDMDKYSGIPGITHVGAYGHRSATLFTSRGCPFRCTFCSAHTVRGRNKRYRSVENVIQEVNLLYEKYGINSLLFWEDLITSDKRTIEIFRLIKKMDIPDFKPVIADLSINASSTELFDALIQLGVNDMCLALESGSEYTQKHIINKNVNLKKARELIKYIRKYDDVTVRINLVLGSPRETKELMSESIEYAKSLNVDWINVITATPLPGSEMYTEFVERGCVNDDLVALSKSLRSGRYRRSFDTPEIKADELNELQDRVNLECNFFENRNYISGDYLKAIGLFDQISRSYPWHIIALYMTMKCFQKLGDNIEAENIKSRISDLIKINEKSREMYEKYKDRMPGFV